MPKYDYILFDLDGTLTDPEEGITKSFQYALKAFGIEIEDLADLRKFIGPPLAGSFHDGFGLEGEQIEEAIRLYRERFKEKGIFENKPYDGIAETLAMLQAAGSKLILATSKPEAFAIRIMEHFHLDQYFHDICGADMDQGKRTEKEEVIAYAMKKNEITDKSRVIMVGDRKYDVEGARINGLPCLGVLFGFGSREELESAGAERIAQDVEEMGRMLTE